MKTVVIGSGISGLTAACTLAQAGHAVTIFEQAAAIGGDVAAVMTAAFKTALKAIDLYF